MPWKEETVKQQRRAFIAEAISEEMSFSALCRKYEITRRTGYKWLERYHSGEDLIERSRKPGAQPSKTPQAVEELLLAVRDKYPTWGGRKILRYLEDRGHENLPAASTVTAILKRNDRISREESSKHTPYVRFEHKQPNDLWQMDFKGHFAMVDGTRCHPLTIGDDHSRMLLCLDAHQNEQWSGVKDSLTRVFLDYGLPRVILCDNGKPWGHNLLNGCTPFELWMMQLDILPIHGRPNHPQTQGKDERFHRTLKEDILMRFDIQNLLHAQEIFTQYQHSFNYERPHGALGLDVPATHYTPSPRKLPDRLLEPEYDANLELRKVNYKGYVCLDKHQYYLSETLAGKYLEVVQEQPKNAMLCYGQFIVAKIDLEQKQFLSRKIYRKQN